MNVKMPDKFLEALDKKMLTLTVLLDLSKEFDGIDHAKRLAKLSTLGVSSSALKWPFKSYLLDLQQYVRNGSEMSYTWSSTTIHSGSGLI